MRKTQRSFNSTIRKSGPPKKTNPARRKREWIRAYGSKERVEFVKSLWCVCWTGECAGKIDNHHIKTGGLSRKADCEFIVPLCAKHHRILHDKGRDTFECSYLIDLDTEAARTEKKWQSMRASLGSSPGGET